MDLLHDSETIDDLSALAWVHDELRRSLEGAHKAMRRYLKEAESAAESDIDAVDPAVLRGARSQMHQGVGALELVGLPTAAQVLRACENALARLSGRPIKLDVAGVETIERTSFALLDYLARLLAQKPVSPLAMFPQYRAVQELAGADRIHPADLWPTDWQWQNVAADGSAPRAADAALRSEVESQTLALMRSGGGEAAAALSDSFAGLAAGAADKPLATLWRMASGFFEAQAQGLLVPDAYSKRIASRLLAQLRIGETQGPAGEVSQRLAQDLLFFCAQAASPGDGRKAPRLAAVRLAWNLARRAPVDYLSTQLGRFDPAAIAQAKKRVAVAKEGWASVAGSELHRLSTLGEQFQLVAESLKKLFPAGERLGTALTAAAAATAASGAEPPAPLAMEVATAVLYLEAALEDGEFDQPAQAERVQRLASRIQQVREGGPAQALDAWMEELYRRVSDRQTMGSVVQELKSSLGEAEKAIDLYFRQNEKRELLHPVPQQLNSMRGVFSVLGLEQASHAIVRMRDDVDALGAGTADAATSEQATQRLASNLGALGFLIDMLNVQPSMAKSLFAFDAASGLLRSVAAPVRQRASGFGALAEAAGMPAPVPVEPRFIEQAQSLALAAAHPEVPLADVQNELERLSQEALVADQPDLAETMHQVQSAFDVARSDAEKTAVREELAQAMADFVHSTSEPMGLDAAPKLRELPLLPTTPTPAGQTGLEDDAEMRDIFLEEAREVIGNAETALAVLAQSSSDLGEMTTVRRSFHTLKGSSRMVGLKDFGEAAWSCEQTYNTRLAEQQNADPALLAITGDVLAYLADWVDAIGARRDGGHHPGAVQAVVDAYAQRGEALPLALPGAAAPRGGSPALTMPVVSSPMPLDEFMPALPSAADLELLPAAATVAPVDCEIETIDFELDLGPAATLPMGVGEPVEPAAIVDAVPDAVSSMMSLELPEVVEEELPALPVVPVIEVASLAAEAAPPADVDRLPEPVPEPEPEPEPFRQIGPLRVGIPLFNIFLNEADEQSRRLGTELAEWAIEHHQQPVGDSAIAHAHSLAGSSATVGFTELSQLARLLEHALTRSQAIGPGHAEEATLFTEAADEIRGLLHQFAAGFLKSPTPALMQRLADHERWAADRLHELSLRAATPDVALPDPEPIAEAVIDSTPAPLTAPGRLGRTEYHELSQVVPLDAPPRVAATTAADDEDEDDDIDAIDAIDAELFPIFQEEALELLPQLAARMRDWAERPGEPGGSDACMRTLHTFKGGARLAGAMRLGELAHRLETAVDRLGAREHPHRDEVEALFGRVDALGSAFEALMHGPRSAPEVESTDVDLPLAFEAPTPAPVVAPPAAAPAFIEPTPVAAPPAPAVAEIIEFPTAPAPAPALVAGPAVTPIDWQRFAAGDVASDRRGGDRVHPGASAGTVRVRAPLLDRLVNHAGEVSIARSRIEAEVEQLKGALGDLTENLERMRSQLRDIELQAETQIASRMEAAKSHGESFDPLEMDRFTRFQELTRMMAESVADVATVQRSAQRTVQAAEDDLAAQARLTRDLQDDLLRTRMVEFESLSDRLYRVARQAAKELQKQVRLDIVGGSIEVDRGVLERMAGAFEHLLRNCVTHGIERPAERQARGKDATGQITISVGHEGNEVAVEFRDDGAGLDLGRIRSRAVAMGLIAADAQPSDAELSQLIFTPGFSTAETVTELSGRGIGMDVVKSEVGAIGGRIETASAPGQGASFRLVLPLTTAVTQVVMLRAGAVTVAVPATLIEIVRRVPTAEVAAAQASGAYVYGEQTLPFFWLGALLQSGGRSDEVPTRTQPVVIVRSAQQRVALHVDEVVGNQEVVVKNLGAQLARLPGLAGVTLLASGAPALIYNPVALATLYGEQARGAMARRPEAPVEARVRVEAQAPLVLVVDDSLTVRRVTQRLLVREGYRVTLAKDGLDALEKLADEVPAIVLSDIEMPRMDGFDLVRNLRADARLSGLPVVMITSRIAQKHRDHAAELGVDHYLGKPYSEEELLALVARYASSTALAH